MRLLSPTLVATALMAAQAASAQPAPPAEAEALTRTYVCEEGAVLRVAYLNCASGESHAVVDFGGQLVPMRAGPTGSGVRYVAFDPENGLVWHSKGDEGVLADDSDSNQQTILRDCRATVG